MLTAGGFCYARMPHPSHLDDLPGLSDLRASDLALSLGLLLSACGLALLTWAWWGLRTLLVAPNQVSDRYGSPWRRGAHR